jgi:hypothetical protein
MPKSYIDWGAYDPQLRQFAAEGVTDTEMTRRLGLKRQSVVDRLKKLGLWRSKQGQKTPPPREETVAVSTIVDSPPVTAPDVLEALSPAETATLEHYERIIEQGLQTFVEVGHALLIIRNQRLYREYAPSFEAYLEVRWDMSRQRAHQLIDAAKVFDTVTTDGTPGPTNEAQAREMTAVEPAKQVEVWQDVLKTAPTSGVTAEHIKKTVNRAQGKTSPAQKTVEQTATEWYRRLVGAFRDLDDTMKAFQKAGGVTLLVPAMDRDAQENLIKTAVFLIEKRLYGFCQALNKTAP